MKIFQFLCFTGILSFTMYVYVAKAQQDTSFLYIPFHQQMVDFNQDKLVDSVVFLKKKTPQDGDSILIVFYKKNILGDLEYFKSLGNLYPIYFQSYDISYTTENEMLKPVFQDYMGLNPNTEIIVKEKKITITKKPNAITYYYEFMFDNKRDNWFLYLHNTSSPTFTSPTERYFLKNSKAIPLEKYNFLLHIKD